MKYILILLVITCNACYGQTIIIGSSGDTIKTNERRLITFPFISRNKDTVYKETVKAKLYIYINDSTIKVVNGFHYYQVHTHERGYWYEVIEPDYYDSVYSITGENGDGIYLKENVLKVEDLEEPKVYNLFRYAPKIRLL